MDYDVERLRSAVADIDDRHHEGMRTMAADIGALQAETRRAVGGATRREFLVRSGLAAAGVTLGTINLSLGSLWSPALGQELDDPTIAAFAASVEFAAVAAYGAAATSGKLTGPVLETAKTFSTHHQQHGDAFAGASAGKATKDPNRTLLNALGPQVSAAKDATAILELAYTVENAAASTYLFALQALKSEEAMKLTASILPVEAGHAVVLGMVLGYKLDEDGGKSAPLRMMPPFQTEDGFLDPAKNPA